MNMLDEFTEDEYNELKNKATNVHSIKRGDSLRNKNGIFATVAVVVEEPWSTPIKRQVCEFTIKTASGELIWLRPDSIISEGWQLLVAEELYLPK